MKSISVLIFATIILLSFRYNSQNLTANKPQPTTIDNSAEEVANNMSYYSDYFVFVATDEQLVIPFDFNWSPSSKGFYREFKAWYGTTEEWPILYIKDHKKSKTVPSNPWEHENIGGFSFDQAARTITIDIETVPELTLEIPENTQWIPLSSQSNNKEIFAFRTSVKRNNKIINGWMIYERIRWDATALNAFGDFRAFYWIPLIIDGDFYHFEMHSGVWEQIASRWYVEDGIVNNEVSTDFTINILKTESDKKSKRKQIPKVLQVQAPSWDIDISLSSEGAQVGYGQQFPRGLAYYRQSILTNTSDSKTSGYGMLELILENN